MPSTYKEDTTIYITKTAWDLSQLHFVLGSIYYIHLVIGETMRGAAWHARYAQDLRQKEEGNTLHAHKIDVWILAPCFCLSTEE